ncbi:MAG TPA: hypothetical protein VD788_06995 [Candidatus Polarisedimenticolaceae bacterium]|nr:hypothetical protein [Candidatus Polarisedimenticolaceae bacterium]
MNARNHWRQARFNNAEERSEFIEHARSIDLDGIEVEPVDNDDVRVRFRAPAKFEIGLAGMVHAHGGKVLPSADADQAVPRPRAARSA